MMKYTILSDYDQNGNRYFYICENDLPLYDEDGNNIHFESFNEAKSFIDEELAM